MRLPQRQTGFTLVELLVVIFIVATVASIALLSIGVAGEDKELDTERRRLASLIETVQDDAILQGREFGIEFMTSAYRFVEFDPLTRQWAGVPGDDLYRMRSLPEGLEFILYVDDKLIELEANPRELADSGKTMTSSGTRPYAPHLFVFASGESTAFEVHLWRPLTDGRLVLRGDVLGQIEFGENDET